MSFLSSVSCDVVLTGWADILLYVARGGERSLSSTDRGLVKICSLFAIGQSTENETIEAD